jgi:aspartyl-tRNA(Asn)/glutamyl-tRNA(Gln) amidotransferase subunit C
MDDKIIKGVARAAHISLTEAEIEKYGRELTDILEYFEILDDAPHISAKGLNPISVFNIVREDKPVAYPNPGELLKDMDTYENYVRGPRLS